MQLCRKKSGSLEDNQTFLRLRHDFTNATFSKNYLTQVATYSFNTKVKIKNARFLYKNSVILDLARLFLQSIEGLSSTVTTLSKPIFEEIFF